MSKKGQDAMKEGSGLLYAVARMTGVILGLMLAVALRMIRDPVFGLVVMIFLVAWWKYVLTL
jgi:hypothetical protein